MGCEHPNRSGDQLCVDCPRRLQNRCPVCDKPFMYLPFRDEVEQREDGLYIHARCRVVVTEVCPACLVALFPTSGGKLQCRACGYLRTCCDTV
jgi:hypothetical protein